MVTIIDNINLLPSPYTEEGDTVMLRVTEMKIEEDLSEIGKITAQQKRDKRNKYTSFLKFYLKLRS